MALKYSKTRYIFLYDVDIISKTDGDNVIKCHIAKHNITDKKVIAKLALIFTFSRLSLACITTL